VAVKGLKGFLFMGPKAIPFQKVSLLKSDSFSKVIPFQSELLLKNDSFSKGVTFGPKNYSFLN